MSATLAHLVRRVRSQMAPGADAGDSSLLTRWIERADQAAFELIVWRHGPMVWDTCRRIVRHEQDAEDAFQAAFLTLARKADSIRQAPSLAGWLHRVASRAALAASSRSRPEARDDLDEVALAHPDDPDLRRCLDEEVGQLPTVYREPFVLCYLQGMTTDEAAAALGCPRGTVATRLAWARQRLRDRLARRGVEMPATLVAPSVPATLVESVVLTVTARAAGEAIAPGVAQLCQEVITMMWMNKIKCVALWLIPVVLVGFGLGGVSLTSARAEKPAKPEKKPAVKPGEAKPDKAKPEKKPVDPADVYGIVKSVGKDGKSITVTVGKKKNADDNTVELKFTDKTEIKYSGVGLDGAKIKEGYVVTAWLEPKSKETAVRVAFQGDALPKGSKASVVGPIETVSDDGKSFTIAIKKKNGNEEKTIKLTDKTVQQFNMVGPGEAKLTKGITAMVWLAKGSEDTAERVQINGTGEIPGKKDGQTPAHRGVVSAVANGGKSFTLTEGPTKKGEDGGKVELKLNDKSKLVFTGIGIGEAKLKAGQSVIVWVDDASKDTVKVGFLQPKQPSKLGSLGGKVTAVGKDGKSFTVQLPATKKESEGKLVEIKLGEKAKVIFDNVPTGGAKISEGYMARILLVEGSEDSASLAVFSPAKK